MPELAGSFRVLQMAHFALLLWVATAVGQNAPFVAITPHTVTMQVGDSRPFQLVDQDGHKQSDVTWTVSDPDALRGENGDEVILTAKRPGEFRLKAQSKAGSDEISVKVMEGTLPAGTVMWSGPVVPGCKPVKLTQAVPSQNGPDLYEESQCEDGYYVTAYTAQGTQLWRRNITAGHSPSGMGGSSSPNSVAGKPLDIHSASICDVISTGTDQQKIHDLLEQHSLSFEADAHSGRLWVVEEKGAECKLWFDDKLVLARKRKTLITE